MNPSSKVGGVGEGDWVLAPDGEITPSGREKLMDNGIVMNRLLAWMEIQKDTTPPDTWQAHLKTLYTEEDILEAKNILFETVGGVDSRIGVFKKHNIKQKHLEDLIEAVDKLWNNDEMPLLVASSHMIKTMRNYNMVDTNKENIADAINKMKEVENTLKACLKENTDQVKNLAEVVVSLGQGQPQVTFGASKPVTGNRVSNMIKQNEKIGNGGVTPSKKRKTDEDNTDNVTATPTVVSGITPMPAKTKSMYPPLPTSDRSPAGPPTPWNTVAARGLGTAQHSAISQAGQDQSRGTPRAQRGAWKKSLNILHGTADSHNTIAADVSLVAYGVAKDATADGLKSFLETKGVAVVECVNLTTFEHARTHCYKVTIKASEYEKATKPEIWPYRVGVRLFKQFRKREEEQISGWDAQVRNAGRAQQVREPAQARAGGGPAHAQQTAEIETSNMFAALHKDLSPDH